MEKNTILFKTFVGIDISKKTIDVCILDNESLNPLIFIKESNDELGIKKVLTQLAAIHRQFPVNIGFHFF